MAIDWGGLLWLLFLAVLIVGWGLSLGRRRAEQERRRTALERERLLHPERMKRIDWGEISYRLWVLFG